MDNSNFNILIISHLPNPKPFLNSSHLWKSVGERNAIELLQSSTHPQLTLSFTFQNISRFSNSHIVSQLTSISDLLIFHIDAFSNLDYDISEHPTIPRVFILDHSHDEVVFEEYKTDTIKLSFKLFQLKQNLELSKEQSKKSSNSLSSLIKIMEFPLSEEIPKLYTKLTLEKYLLELNVKPHIIEYNLDHQIKQYLLTSNPNESFHFFELIEKLFLEYQPNVLLDKTETESIFELFEKKEEKFIIPLKKIRKPKRKRKN